MKLQLAKFLVVMSCHASLIFVNTCSAAKFIPFEINSPKSEIAYQPHLTSISNNGVAAGYVEYEEFNVCGSCGLQEAFIWSEQTGIEYIGLSQAWHITADGTKVLGKGEARVQDDLRHFVWTSSDGISEFSAVAIPNSNPIMSSDGNTFAGITNGDDRGFVWSATDGLIRIEKLAGADYSTLDDISADGRVGIGITSSSADSYFQWTVDAGAAAMPSPTGADTFRVLDLSSSGATAVGVAPAYGPLLDRRAVLWIDGAPFGDEPVLLETPEGYGSAGYLVANDASMVIGRLYSSNDTNQPGYRTLAVWREGRGWKSFADLLADEYGLAHEISGWNFDDVTPLGFSLSDNGRYFAGRAINPDGQQQSYIVEFHGVPEPSSVVLLSCAGVAALLASQRRRR